MKLLPAYNFFAKKSNFPEFSSEEDLQQAIVNGTAKKQFIPRFWFCIYDINKKTVIATVFTVRDHFEIVKVANDAVIELYRRITQSPPVVFKSYDLVDTNKELEYYLVGNNMRLIKYDIDTKQETGFTTDGAFLDLPKEYQDKLVNFQYKNQILYWADKLYGQIIGVTCPIEEQK